MFLLLLHRYSSTICALGGIRKREQCGWGGCTNALQGMVTKLPATKADQICKGHF